MLMKEISKEEKILEAVLNDKKLKELNNALVNLYEKQQPKEIIVKNHIVNFKYDDKFYTFEKNIKEEINFR